MSERNQELQRESVTRVNNDEPIRRQRAEWVSVYLLEYCVNEGRVFVMCGVVGGLNLGQLLRSYLVSCGSLCVYLFVYLVAS